MKLTDYYLMEEIKPLKSHRFDCICSTGEYEPFETIAQRSKTGNFFCYYTGVPDSFTAEAQRKTDRVLTNGKNISSVFIPSLDEPLKGYGDTANTDDALLFNFSNDYKRLEIFVARGYRNNQKQLFDLFLDGELDDEISTLKKRAKDSKNRG